MILYSVITLVFLLMSFGIYKLLKRKKNASKRPKVSEEDLQPYLQDIDVKKEKKVRKRWLTIFCIIQFLNFLFFFLHFSIDGFTESPSNKELTFMLVFFFLFSALIVMPVFWITYHCSYKKRGTKWLMFILILTPLAGAARILSGEESQMLATVDVAILAYYWIHCLRLYKVNALRKQKTKIALKELCAT